MTTTTKAPMVDQGFADKGVRHRPRKTHCVRGHARTLDNVTRHGDCAECRREHSKAQSAARAAQRAHERAVAHIRHAANVAGRDRLIAARRARGVPADGWCVE